MNIKDIGLYLQKKRKEKGYTQGDLAEILNVSHQAVSRWETGENLPDVIKLSELSKLYNISIEDIINQEEEIIKEPKRNDIESNYFMFTIINIVVSSISVFLLYLLGVTGAKLWLVILVQYFLVLGISLFYILPFVNAKVKTRKLYKLFRINVLVSAGALLMPFTLLMLFSMYYFFIAPTLIVLAITVVILLSINAGLLYGEEKLFNVTIKNKLIITKKIPPRTLIEIIISFSISWFLVIIWDIASDEIFKNIVLGILILSVVVFMYYLIRNFKFISLYFYLFYVFLVGSIVQFSSTVGYFNEAEFKELVEISDLIETATFWFTIVGLGLMIVYGYIHRKQLGKKITPVFGIFFINFMIIQLRNLTGPSLMIKITTVTGYRTYIEYKYISDFEVTALLPIAAMMSLALILLIVNKEVKTYKRKHAI